MDDLISRQAAIDAVRLYEDDEDINLDEVIATVAHLPSAQPEWILCSERLPDEAYPVIVTWKNDDPASYYQYIL